MAVLHCKATERYGTLYYKYKAGVKARISLLIPII